MADGFKDIALNYDQQFTFSEVGLRQRKQVYQHFLKSYKQQKGLNILEINGGTGHDAVWLSQLGHQVTFSDLSPAMIGLAKNNFKDAQIKSMELDVKDIHSLDLPNPLDLIFSNFGGLNCLSPEELSTFFKDVFYKLNSKGSLVMVIMPKDCLWEKLFFTLKREWAKVNRRNNKKNDVSLGNQTVSTYFYNPKNIKTMLKGQYTIEKIKPIGLFIPPSYLEPLFANKKPLLNFFQSLDLFWSKFSFLAKFADHYYLELKKK